MTKNEQEKTTEFLPHPISRAQSAPVRSEESGVQKPATSFLHLVRTQSERMPLTRNPGDKVYGFGLNQRHYNANDEFLGTYEELRNKTQINR